VKAGAFFFTSCISHNGAPGRRLSTDGEDDQNPSMSAMPRRAGAMNGMKHVPSVISSAWIRDLLELDNVAQGCVGIVTCGSSVSSSRSSIK
jgi:hypothetical protein